DARGADHDDLARQDLVPDLVGRLGAAPAAAHRGRDGLLRDFLSHDVAVELRHDLAPRQPVEPGERLLLDRLVRRDGLFRGAGRFRHHSSRMLMCALVYAHIAAANWKVHYTITFACS